MKEDKKRRMRGRMKCKVCGGRTKPNCFVWFTKICEDCFGKLLSKQMGIPWDEYGKRTVNDAVAELPESLANPIVRAFKATNAMDVYGGNLAMYLTVIAQRLEDQSNKIGELGGIIAEAATTIGNVSGYLKEMKGNCTHGTK
jgi:hypothetical protein